MAIVSDDYRREQELLRKDPIILGMAVGLGDISLDEISHPNGTPTHGFMGAANKRYHDQAGKHSMSIGGVGAAVIHVLKSMRAGDQVNPSKQRTDENRDRSSNPYLGTYRGQFKVRGVVEMPNFTQVSLHNASSFAGHTYLILFRAGGDVVVTGAHKRLLKQTCSTAQELFRCLASSGKCPPKFLPLVLNRISASGDAR